MEDIPAKGTDLNWFEDERVLAFGGFSDPRTPTTMLGCRVTRHPNREIVDAAATIVAHGVQTSLHASARLPPDAGGWDAGPIRFRPGPEPGERTFTITDDLGMGTAGSVRHSREAVWFRPPRWRSPGDPLAGTRSARDAWGILDAQVTVDGDAVPVGPQSLHRVEHGSHDRSELRARDARAPAHVAPQRCWQRAVLWNAAGDLGARIEIDQGADGDIRSRSAFVAGGPSAPLTGSPADVDVIAVSIDLQAGSRWPARLRVDLAPGPDGGGTSGGGRVELRTALTVPMVGLGEHHATWVPGRWHDELAVGVERWALADLDPTDVRHVHVAQFVHGTVLDQPVVGVLESLILGPHSPSGLAGFTDGCQP